MVTLRFTFRIHSDLWSYVVTSRSQKLKSHLSAEPLPVGSWVHRIKNIPHGRLSKSASWPLTLDDIQEVISRSTSGKSWKMPLEQFWGQIQPHIGLSTHGLRILGPFWNQKLNPTFVTVPDSPVILPTLSDIRWLPEFKMVATASGFKGRHLEFR